jgi:hypothetical protein
VLLPLRVEGIDHVGDYSGTLDLAPEPGDEPQEAKVTVSVTDYFLFAILAVLIGAGLTLASQLWLRRYGVRRRLHARLTGLEKAYSKGARKLHDRFPEYAAIHGPRPEVLDRYVSDVAKAIEVDMKSSWYFDSDSGAYQEIVKSIDLAEDDAKFLGSVRGLGRHLKDLEAALGQLEGPAGDLQVDRKPAFVAVAQAVLKGGDLEVGEATARGGTADSYVSFVDQFKLLAVRVRQLEPWAAALLVDAGNNAADWTEFEVQLLYAATAKVLEAKHELLDATDPTALEQLGAERDLDRAYGTFAILGSRHGIWWSDLPAAAPTAEEAPALLFAMPDGGAAASLGLPAVGELIVAAAKPTVLHKSLGWIADAGVLVLAVVTGLVGALAAFYFGQAWGSTVDYLTAIFIGGGAQLLTSGVGDTVTKLTVGTRTARVAETPQTASVAAQPPAELAAIP